MSADWIYKGKARLISTHPVVFKGIDRSLQGPDCRVEIVPNEIVNVLTRVDGDQFAFQQQLERDVIMVLPSGAVHCLLEEEDGDDSLPLPTDGCVNFELIIWEE